LHTPNFRKKKIPQKSIEGMVGFIEGVVIV